MREAPGFFVFINMVFMMSMVKTEELLEAAES